MNEQDNEGSISPPQQQFKGGSASVELYLSHNEGGEFPMHESFDVNISFNNDEIIKDDFNLDLHDQITATHDNNKRRSMSNYDRKSV